MKIPNINPEVERLLEENRERRVKVVSRDPLTVEIEGLLEHVESPGEYWSIQVGDDVRRVHVFDLASVRCVYQNPGQILAIYLK